jgi:hypothetical protein
LPLSLPLLAFALAQVSPNADEGGWMIEDEVGNENGTSNRNFTVPGASQAVANTLLRSMRLEQRKRDLCWQLGCIVIVNESNGYKVTRFLVGETVRGERRWSRNQFGRPLLAKRTTYRFKMPGDECERPVKFVLERTDNKDRIDLETRVNFCPTPHVHSLLRLNVLTPRVIVE